MSQRTRIAERLIDPISARPLQEPAESIAASSVLQTGRFACNLAAWKVAGHETADFTAGVLGATPGFLTRPRRVLAGDETPRIGFLRMTSADDSAHLLAAVWPAGS